MSALKQEPLLERFITNCVELAKVVEDLGELDEPEAFRDDLADARAELASLRKRAEDAESRCRCYESALNWAFGTKGEFPMRKEGQGAYWWRPELGRRACMKYDGDQARFVPDDAARAAIAKELGR